MATSEIKFNAYSIQDVFNNFYKIPDYQREYVWTADQANTMLEDIFREFQANPDSEYFLGTIVTCENEDKYEVIDGQQRLITISLTLNAFKPIYQRHGQDKSVIHTKLSSTRILQNGKVNTSYTVELDYEGKDTLYDLINEKRESIGEQETLTGQNMLDVDRAIAEFFISNFNENNDFESVQQFFGYFVNKVKLIQIETPDISNALKIFETINDRGVGLDPVDLLKNLLFLQTDRDGFEKLKDEWHIFKKQLEKKEKLLRFLRYFITANYNTYDEKTKEYILREVQVYKWLLDHDDEVNYKNEPIQFTKKLQNYSVFYLSALNGKFNSERDSTLDNISRLVGSNYKQHAVLFLAAKHLNEELFHYFISQLEVLLFTYIISRHPAKEIEKKFSRWGNSLQSIKTEAKITKFIKEIFEPEVISFEKAYEFNFKNLSLKNTNKNRVKYIIARITKYIDNCRVGHADNTLLDDYLLRAIHLEHILPGNPSDDLRDSFTPKGEYDVYKNKLGNLALLEQPLNEAAGRNFFETKLPFLGESRFYLTKSIVQLDQSTSNSSISRINNKLLAFTEWNAESIDKRQDMLYKLSKDIWKISFLSE